MGGCGLDDGSGDAFHSIEVEFDVFEGGFDILGEGAGAALEIGWFLGYFEMLL